HLDLAGGELDGLIAGPTGEHHVALDGVLGEELLLRGVEERHVAEAGAVGELDLPLGLSPRRPHAGRARRAGHDAEGDGAPQEASAREHARYVTGGPLVHGYRPLRRIVASN